MNEVSSKEKYKFLCEQTAGKFEGFLYDCDGTLADNMQAHKDSYVEIAAQSGVSIDPQIIDEFAGYPITEVVKEINKRFNVSFDPAQFEKQKSELFHNKYVVNTKPIEFVVQHLKEHAEKYKIGVVSGGTRKTVEKTLKVLGIYELVEVLICAGETAKGKPYPDPFLVAAEQLGVSPEKCVVFEDGEAGVKAAIAAGMKWIRIDKI